MGRGAFKRSGKCARPFRCRAPFRLKRDDLAALKPVGAAKLIGFTAIAQRGHRAPAHGAKTRRSSSIMAKRQEQQIARRSCAASAVISGSG
jgi:hypothetical protein